MAPIVPRPDRIREFRDRHEFEAWLAANHAREDEVWLKLHKKGSGLPSVSVAEALEIVLCWGWIDGIRKGMDEKSFLQRYSPRGSRSLWSEINKAHVERLTEAGRMRAPGLLQVEAAKADGRWERAYRGARTIEYPADLLAAIDGEASARKMFDTLNSQNRYALAFRLHNMKTPAGRARKIESFVEMLKRGQSIYPNGAGRRK